MIKEKCEISIFLKNILFCGNVIKKLMISIINISKTDTKLTSMTHFQHSLKQKIAGGKYTPKSIKFQCLTQNISNSIYFFLGTFYFLYDKPLSYPFNGFHICSNFAPVKLYWDCKLFFLSFTGVGIKFVKLLV